MWFFLCLTYLFLLKLMGLKFFNHINIGKLVETIDILEDYVFSYQT